MRPRPEGRGERPLIGIGLLAPSSFNAATTRRSWRTIKAILDSLPTHGFNAATTRRSWRTPAAALCLGRSPGFNAATTRRSWRTLDTVKSSADALLGASMRPRPEGRGEPPVSFPPSYYRLVLQCGHDPKVVENPSARSSGRRSIIRFNAATTRRSWRTPGGARHYMGWTTLQCGHDPKVVENQNGRWLLSVKRKLQCGHDPKVVENDGAFRAGALLIGASMRPRPEGRGERHYAVPALWGEDALQCGHDPKVVENTAPARSSSASGRRRFNAATTRRSWRTLRRGACRRLPRLLQCGHDPKVVENQDSTGDRPTARTASMRPRPEGRGERRLASIVQSAK